MPDAIVSVSAAIEAFRSSPILRDLSATVRLWNETINSPAFVRQWNEAINAFKSFQGSPAAKWLAEQATRSRPI
jgi:hypothetical protein